MYTQYAHAFLYVHTFLVCWVCCPLLVPLSPPPKHRKCLLLKSFMTGLWSQDWGPFLGFSGDTNPLSLSTLIHAFTERRLWSFLAMSCLLHLSLRTVRWCEPAGKSWPWDFLGEHRDGAGESPPHPTPDNGTKHRFCHLLTNLRIFISPSPAGPETSEPLFCCLPHFIVFCFTGLTSCYFSTQDSGFPGFRNNVTSPFVSLVPGIKTPSLWME